MRTATAGWLAVLGTATLASCGADRVCHPGDYQSCHCGGGVRGIQFCAEDGFGWGFCDCGPGDADADADDGDGDVRRETDGWTPDDFDDGGDDDAEPPPCNLVTFRYRDATAASVWVTGTFTSWGATPAAGALEMARASGDLWEREVLVEPEGRHEYKFIVDGTRWVADPANPDRVPDGFGGENSVLWVCEAVCATDGFDWRDAVMYFLLVDRFYDSDGLADPVTGVSGGDPLTGPSGQYAGGDLAGVEARLGYLAGLGVTALWLSAPYENRDLAGAAIDPASDPHSYSAYHGYWPSPADVSYADPANPTPRPLVESRIGTEADLRRLVAAAHSAPAPGGHGIRVLFDYVMNHVDIESGLYRAHYDWFARRPDGRFALCGPEGLWDDPYWGTRCAFTDYLPPFDFENAAPRAWSVADAVWWAVEFGIDGYRLDAIKHVPLVWLTDLRAALGAAIPDPAGGRFYLVGETFDYGNRDLLRRFVDPATMLDGQFDFPLKARLCEAVFTPEGRMDSLASWMAGNDGYYGPGSIMTTWIGNHDIPRAVHFASRQIGNCMEGSHPGNAWTGDYSQPTTVEPYERLGVAFAILMTNPGIPLIYYGDEVGLAGGGDPDNRRMMSWDDGALGAHRIALRDRVSALGRIRAQHPVLGRGRRVTESADQDTWVYRMTGCSDADDVIVAVNRADTARSVAVPAGSYVDLVTGAPVAGGSGSLAPRSFLILGPR